MSRMPAAFIGHGSPMNAIEHNPFTEEWAAFAASLSSPPRAILCVSAHWETQGAAAVTTSAAPPTLHDFFGFPKTLMDVRYPAAGAPGLHARISELLKGVATVEADPRRGLDHGSWSVLLPMFPQAQIPVVQLSLDRAQPSAGHYAIGRALAPLRDEGVLILGSGNLVHNLGMLDWYQGHGYAWAERINQELRQRITADDHPALVDFGSLDKEIRLAVPTPEHYLPLLYVLGAQQADEKARFFNDRCVMGSIAMTSVVFGG